MKQLYTLRNVFLGSSNCGFAEIKGKTLAKKSFFVLNISMDIKRVIIMILDSLGVGDAPDSAQYGDTGVNTLYHIAREYPNTLKNLEMMGFGNILPAPDGIPPQKYCFSSYGKAQEISAGKDSTSGHWELAGLAKIEPFPLYPEGFPPRILEEFKKMISSEVLGNYPASGTAIINDLGEEHVRTGFPIVYTSGDSVFQLAAHEEIIPLDTLYRWCRIARNILSGKDLVGRVIARPFIGDEKNGFTRTANRRDFSASPPENTVLDNCLIAGLSVLGIGKIEDLYAGKGLSTAIHTKSNLEGIETTIRAIRKKLPDDNVENGIIMVNLVDFDMKYGHRRDVEGYYRALQEFDEKLPEILGFMEPADVLILTADHGNDPTFKGSDHTREYVPVMVYGQNLRRGVDLGLRESFADIGQTAAHMLGVNRTLFGKSFLGELITETENIKLDISDQEFDVFLFSPADYRQDIYFLTKALRDSGNRVNIFISNELADCSFETGECYYSTLPSNKKDSYDTIVIPVTDDRIAFQLAGLSGDDPLFDEIRREIDRGNPPIALFPNRWLAADQGFGIVKKRRENISRFREIGLRVASFDRAAVELNKSIRRIHI